MIQEIILCGELPFQSTLSTLVMIPKRESGDLRAISLTDALWKLCGKIIDTRLTEGIRWHPSVHGFRRKRGTGTAILEVKLMANLMEHRGDTMFQVFLDLRKAFDKISRPRLLQLLEEYGVGATTRRLIQYYWTAQQTELRQRDFHGEVFHPESGVTQGDVLSPTLFNIAIDFVCRSLEAKIDTNNSTRLSSLIIFYSNDGYIGGQDFWRVQKMTDEVTRLFATLGLECNVSKTKAMANVVSNFRTGIDIGAYERRWNRQLPTFREKAKEHVTCPSCSKQMQRESLARHLRFKHFLPSVNISTLMRKESNELEKEILTISTSGGRCPKEGCPYQGPDHNGLRKHLRSCHPWDIVTSDDLDLQQCPSCLMYLLGGIPPNHSRTKDCVKYTDRNRRMKQRDVNRRDAGRKLTVDDTPLESVMVFKYLGRAITQNDDNWMVVSSNIANARKKWGRIKVILKKDTSIPHTMANSYKAVLLYGSETWSMSEIMLHKLDMFHQQCCRHIAGAYIHPDPDNPSNWIYPSTHGIMKGIGVKSIKSYVAKRRATLKSTVRSCSRVLPECLRIRNPKQLAWWRLCA